MLVVNSSCGFGSNVDSDRSLFRLLYRPIGQAKNVAFVCDVTNGKKGSQGIQSVLVFVHLFLEKRLQGLKSCMVIVQRGSRCRSCRYDGVEAGGPNGQLRPNLANWYRGCKHGMVLHRAHVLIQSLATGAFMTRAFLERRGVSQEGPGPAVKSAEVPSFQTGSLLSVFFFPSNL